MIKKLTTLSALALAFASVPALAQSGHIGGVYASNSDIDFDVWGVEGSSSYNLNDSVSVKVDGGLASYDDGFDSNLGWRLNGHIFYNAGDFRIGAVAGTAQLDSSGNNPTASHWGLEGQYWFDRVAVSGSATWGSTDWIISPNIDFSNYDISADFYATNNLVIGATYGVGSADNGATDADTTNYAIDAEWKFDNSPVSVVGGFNHWEIQDTPVQSEAWTIGVRWNWGEDLKARDHADFRHSAQGLIGRFIGF